MERQTPFVENGCDHGARLLESGQAFGHHDDVIGIPGDPVASPQLCGQSLKGDIRQPWAAHSSDNGANVFFQGEERRGGDRSCTPP
jgi:hypothetical protein